MTPWNTIKGAVHDSLDSDEDINAEIQEKLRGSRPHSIIERCVQEADYWASRKFMSFFPGQNIQLNL